MVTSNKLLNVMAAWLTARTILLSRRGLLKGSSSTVQAPTAS